MKIARSDHAVNRRGLNALLQKTEHGDMVGAMTIFKGTAERR